MTTELVRLKPTGICPLRAVELDCTVFSELQFIVHCFMLR